MNHNKGTDWDVQNEKRGRAGATNPGNGSTSKEHDAHIGEKGGRASQQGNTLTDEDRSKGGNISSSQQDMRELGREGGSK